jgi:uncharacterized protein YndB with AHSA1/START domain
MKTDTGLSLRVSRTINADPDTVFRAWTDPAQLKDWWYTQKGGRFGGAEIDLAVGGRYRIRMIAPDGRTFTAVGVFQVVERPRRLVYTWDWEEEANRLGETLVTVEFGALGDATEVVLTHERFPSAERRGGHEQGWQELLARLEQRYA